jgi:hypothetical protein
MRLARRAHQEIVMTTLEWLWYSILGLALLFYAIVFGVTYGAPLLALPLVAGAVVVMLFAWRELALWRSAADYRGTRLALRHQATILHRSGEVGILECEDAIFVVIPPETGRWQHHVRILRLSSEDLYNEVHLSAEGSAPTPAVMYSIFLNRTIPVIRTPMVVEIRDWIVHTDEVDDGREAQRVSFDLETVWEGLGSIPVIERNELMITGALTSDLPEMKQLCLELQEAGIVSA